MMVKNKYGETRYQWSLNFEHILPLNKIMTEPYVSKVYNRARRSLLTQFRCGILHIKIETGKYTQMPIEYRLYILCEENANEDENHFLFECRFYNTITNTYFQSFKEICPDFDQMNYENRFKYLMSTVVVKLTAEFIYRCYCKRRVSFITSMFKPPLLFSLCNSMYSTFYYHL